MKIEIEIPDGEWGDDCKLISLDELLGGHVCLLYNKKLQDKFSERHTDDVKIIKTKSNKNITVRCPVCRGLMSMKSEAVGVICPHCKSELENR